MKNPPQFPRRCRFVYAALCGQLGSTPFTITHGAWRNVDIVVITGRSSSDRKLRELINAVPGLVDFRWIKGDDGTRFKVFWINKDYKEDDHG